MAVPSSELARDTLELIISEIVLGASPRDVPDLDVGKVCMHTHEHKRTHARTRHSVRVASRQELLSRSWSQALHANSDTVPAAPGGISEIQGRDRKHGTMPKDWRDL